MRRGAGATLIAATGETLWVLLTGASILGFAVGPWGFVMRVAVLGASGYALARTRPSGPPSTPVCVLGLFFLAGLAHLHLIGPRTVGDGTMYYVYVRSVWKDADLDFANEYGYYGLLRPDRGDLMALTPTGHRRSIFAIGPTVLWSPFFLLGEGVGRLHQAAGRSIDLSGYGDVHWKAVALGTYVYGCAGILILYTLLARAFRPRVALAASILVGWGTFLYWYMVHQPTYAHAPSFFLVVLVLWQWERLQDRGSLWRFAVWGLTLGLAMAVRWQNGVFLLLPALEILWRRRDRLAERMRAGAACAVGLGVGVLPQLVAWRVIFGEWLLRHPPHGADFMRLDRPFVLETLFSSRHGLLSWTPILWLGYLGYIPLIRRRPGWALPLLAPLLIMTYVNACSGDWWAGAAFSNRRFDSCLPLLALGVAAALDTLGRFVAARPAPAVAALAVPVIAINLALAEARANRDSGPEGRTFARVAEETWSSLAARVGSPPTWPASWVFAWRHERSPQQYDLLVGRYLFYRQNNLRGRIELGGAGDEAYLAGGWGERGMGTERRFRRLAGRGRLLVPLETPRALELAVLARASGAGRARIRIAINGEHIGTVDVEETWSARRVTAHGQVWRPNLNDVVLDSSPQEVDVDALVFSPATGDVP